LRNHRAPRTIERQLCETYLQMSHDERPLAESLNEFRDSTIIVAEGFEERSLGVLEAFARAGARARGIVIGRYETGDDLNGLYRDRFEQLAQLVAPGSWEVLPNYNDGEWVRAALAGSDDVVLVDITGVSNRALFPTLDALSASGRKVSIVYTEAAEYWPKHADWKRLRHQLTTHESLAELVDKQPWLFSYEHRVEIVAGHEGYDASGSGRALVAFLHYKCARLAAVLAIEDYSDMMFIAGRPRSSELAWRVGALKQINESLTKGWPVVEMKTFGYRNTLRRLMNLLIREDSLLWRYDVHFAALGSKLQTVGSWVFSGIVPSITVITSVPSRYFREAFSEGIGRSWVLELVPPDAGTYSRDEI
jgi:hypothetical protein